MSTDMIVISNFARNRVILLDGKHPLLFNAEGVAKCPAHLRGALEVEMRGKPGRFTIVESAPAAVSVAAPVEVEVEVDLTEEVPEAASASAPGLDQTFLTETPVKAKKSKKTD